MHDREGESVPEPESTKCQHVNQHYVRMVQRVQCVFIFLGA